MKAILLLIVLLTSPLAAQTKYVDVKVTGMYYNNVWKTTSAYPISVYTDLEANAYIRLDGPVTAAGFVHPDNLDAVIAALKKSLTWSEKAKEAGLEATKELANFQTLHQDKNQGPGFTFVSSDAGEISLLLLQMIDFNNSFQKVTFALTPEQVGQLIAALEAVPDAFHTLKKGTGKADEILQ